MSLMGLGAVPRLVFAESPSSCYLVCPRITRDWLKWGRGVKAAKCRLSSSIHNVAGRAGRTGTEVVVCRLEMGVPDQPTGLGSSR